ncbi:pre-peptidase C-terminal domain-containing protein [Aliikangiella coralliicola]|uniref:Peptidoglycan DD-metalloendopeptidase family protein n=1 Tax=Aliikangiella coralliicola TaxID=2592383 RepID=A0A545TZY8_9GAMM|nr:pre-peptidase C-terminal domain-containing protein [Aliikangiella coralliicola]TQV82779.1 peptidoglycan DD-metalloendopeptidase family protein [Aliikangiella coralliicola]
MSSIIRNNKFIAGVAILLVLMSTKSFHTIASNKVVNDKQVQDSGAETLTNAISKSDLVYSYDEMFNFNIENYLEKNAPHLAAHSEAISHYAGRSSISPKIIIALIEYQTGLVRKNNGDLKLPFGNLSKKSDFNGQVADIADRLSRAFYDGHSFHDTGLNAKRTGDEDANRAIQTIIASGEKTNTLNANVENERRSFNSVFRQLFPETKLKSNEREGGAIQMVPANNFLQLPYPVGKTWTYGGSHTSTGSGSYPQSSLDFNNGGRWGDNLTRIWVTSSAGGRVVRHSSCFLEVVHRGGWSTTYYHLSGIRVNHGSTVSRNTRLANYASNRNQALCNGGASTGPHLHFSLKKNGQYYHLNNVSLSGFKVHTGRNSYDSNCNYFWLRKNNNYYCAWEWINNPGVDGDTEPTIWPMRNGQVKKYIYGDQGAKYYYKIDVPAGASNLQIAASNGSGDADLYVKLGGLPTTGSYDCRPWKNNNNETCSFKTPGSGSWYAMLHAYESFSGLSLKTTYSGGGGGYKDDNIYISQGSWRRYWIEVPEGMKTLTVKTTANNGDADLYVKKTSYPDKDNWDCRPYDGDSNEICTFNNPESRRWYIGIYGYEAVDGLTMEARWKP